MKKVGLLTFHRALNYGAVLQAYALQRAIIERGYDCEIMDYVTPSHKKEEELAISGKGIIPLYNKKRYEGFCKFRDKYLLLGDKEYQKEKDFRNDCHRYDIYVVGSDQVWNPDFVAIGVSSKIYFLHLDEFKNKIAYAASIGTAKPSRLAPFYKYIADFDSVYMRETETAEFLNQHLEETIEQADDPVLLLSRKEWRKIAHKKINVEPYVLFYQVRKDDFSFNMAKKIARLLKMRLIVISYLDEYRGRNVYNCREADPILFLNLIKNAQLVCTTSFHATAFSIIYNIPFYTFHQMENDYRITNILKRFSLEERLVRKDGKVPSKERILQSPDISDTDYQMYRTNAIEKLERAFRKIDETNE